MFCIGVAGHGWEVCRRISDSAYRILTGASACAMDRLG